MIQTLRVLSEKFLIYLYFVSGHKTLWKRPYKLLRSSEQYFGLIYREAIILKNVQQNRNIQSNL